MKKNINNNIQDLRKEMGGKSLRFFAETYFPHYCKKNFAHFQLHLFDYLSKITLKKRGSQLAIAAPRGNAKSCMVSLMCALWCICYGYEKFIVIFSSTRQQSEKLLSHIKKELSSNNDLKQDFPEVCERPNPRWRADEIITKNNVCIMSSSVGQAMRGVRHGEARPGLIILDDIEATESVRSQEQREKVCDWFTKDILNLGSEKTNYIAVGTILHFDSLLAKLLSKEEFPGWEKLMYKSVIKFSDRQDLWDRWGRVYCNKESYNEDSGPEAAMKFFVDNEAEMLRGVEVLWPDKETYYDLMVMREQKGSLSFDSEKQNEPRDTSGLSIDMNKVVFWEDKFQALEDMENFLGTQKVVLGACDPSIARTNKSDYSAIITVYMNKANKDLYVIRADVGRWNLETLVQTICVQHETHGFTTFLYEANAAQAWLGDIIKKEPVIVPIKPITNVIPKEARIMKLKLYLEQGKIKLSRNLTELNRQLEQYPYGAHDDAIDALAMIIDVAESFSKLDVNSVNSAFNTVKKPCIGLSSKSFMYGGRTYENHFNLFKF